MVLAFISETLFYLYTSFLQPNYFDIVSYAMEVYNSSGANINHLKSLLLDYYNNYWAGKRD